MPQKDVVRITEYSFKVACVEAKWSLEKLQDPHWIQISGPMWSVQLSVSFILMLKLLATTRCIKIRARSQVPVFGLTGHAPTWPGALKLPGATV